MKLKLKGGKPKLRLKEAKPKREVLPPPPPDRSHVGQMIHHMAGKLPPLDPNNPRYLTLEQIERAWILREPDTVVAPKSKLKFRTQEAPRLKLKGGKPKLLLAKKSRTLWFHPESDSYVEIFGDVDDKTARQCEDVSGNVQHELEFERYKKQQQKPKLQLKPKGKPRFSFKKKS